MTKKLFTPVEANRTLPLVQRIVGDILGTGKKLRAQANSEKDSTGKDKGPSDRLRDLDRELRRLMDELARIGCEYKDWNFEVGLVDFPATIGGKPVLLCWRSDEPSVAWYHSVESGFSGRRPIPSDLLEDDRQPARAAQR